ncbi:hypothetical protein JTB14_010730 [Gonioctena quinquepunctata]|nr:hypothetical protein JTB14_010730 [Gonioctena quinquepunctata]
MSRGATTWCQDPWIPTCTQTRRGKTTKRTGAEYAGLPCAGQRVSSQSPNPTCPGRPTDTTRHLTHLAPFLVTACGHTKHTVQKSHCRPHLLLNLQSPFDPVLPTAQQGQTWREPTCHDLPPAPKYILFPSADHASIKSTAFPAPATPYRPPPPPPTTPTIGLDKIIAALRANPNRCKARNKSALKPSPDRPQGRFRARLRLRAAAYVCGAPSGQENNRMIFPSF